MFNDSDEFYHKLMISQLCRNTFTECRNDKHRNVKLIKNQSSRFSASKYFSKEISKKIKVGFLITAFYGNKAGGLWSDIFEYIQFVYIVL